ncbi:MAG: hypothetical protein AAGF46_06160 [Pseudomonadota bacterium]
METAGLAALGFWLFIGAATLGGIWYDVKSKEVQQETLRRLLESGREIDPELLDKLAGGAENRNLARDLRVGALIVLGVSPGLFVFAVFLSFVNSDAFFALTGVSFLVGFIGGGLMLASRVVERSEAEK